MKVDVFISYSHRDQRLAERLRDHLAPLKQRELISDWYDRKIEPGEDWSETINEQLNGCKLVLLLLSPSFFASEYCMGVEVKQALVLHDNGEARVIPILLRDVEWAGTSLARLQALPPNARPVVRWRDRDQALREVARGIGQAAEVVGRIEKDRPDTENTNGINQDAYYLNHTSFLREEKQQEFRLRTGVPLDHYDIRIVVDAYDERDLNQIERVEYTLHPAYDEQIRIRTKRERPQKFLLKEIANGEYLVLAKIFVKGRQEPLQVHRYITLWESGPELP